MEKLRELDVDSIELTPSFSDLLEAMNESKDLPLLKEDFSSRLQHLQCESNEATRNLEKIKLAEAEAIQRINTMMASLNEKIITKEELEKHIQETRLRIEELESDFNSNGSNNDSNLLEVYRKLLNAFKRLLKVKWFFGGSNAQVSGLIFNENTGYLSPVHIDVEHVDNSTVEQMWSEVGKACSFR